MIRVAKVSCCLKAKAVYKQNNKIQNQYSWLCQIVIGWIQNSLNCSWNSGENRKKFRYWWTKDGTFIEEGGKLVRELEIIMYVLELFEAEIRQGKEKRKQYSAETKRREGVMKAKKVVKSVKKNKEGKNEPVKHKQQQIKGLYPSILDGYGSPSPYAIQDKWQVQLDCNTSMAVSTSHQTLPPYIGWDSWKIIWSKTLRIKKSGFNTST